MKKSVKKLVLSKETVRVLQDTELKRLVGGQGPGAGGSHPCNTTTVGSTPCLCVGVLIVEQPRQ
jgi:natural product precursor